MNVSPTSNALFTDLYQLTMAQAYFQSGQTGNATFSLFFRNFPSSRSFYVYCGLESVLDYLAEFAFSDADIQGLEALGIFDADFLGYLRELEFSGNMWSMDEGELFFPNEPILEISGPIIECQLVETFLLNQVNLESMLATKSTRVVEAANGRTVVDFAARRTQGMDAGMKMARASYIAGFAGTSNVAAASKYGIPAVGTMAHSFISSFDNELDAFGAYAGSFPDSSTFLVDTYDTIGGVKNAISVAKQMESEGHRLRAVRLDSGDLGELARESRSLIDQAGLDYVQILASGGLDEYSVSELVESGAPIDGFGVGTRVGTSADAPYTDFVYKLVEYDGEPVMKLSDTKVTLPGSKQVFRRFDPAGYMVGDVIALRNGDRPIKEGEGLLKSVMKDGSVTRTHPTLKEIRDYHTRRMLTLPRSFRSLKQADEYLVEMSDTLDELTTTVAKRTKVELRNTS